MRERERELKYGIKGELGGERVELRRQNQRLSNPTTMTLNSFVVLPLPLSPYHFIELP